MAYEKNLTTRIVLTHDEYSALKNKKLKEGEVVLAKVGTTEANGKVSEPIWMMKVGDGTSTVENCPWLIAPAADVYEWAKKASLDVNDVPTLPIAKIDGLQNALDNKADKSEFDNHNHDNVYKKIQDEVAESGAADKTLKISQDAQGKISVTPVAIDIKASQINDFAVEVAKVKVTAATKADEATKDASGNVITETYATKNELTGAKTEVSNLANSIAGGIQNGNIVAAKATADAQGNVIADTYATIGELQGVTANINTLQNNLTQGSITVGKAVEADTLDGKHAADFAEAGHNHKASDLTDFSEDVKAVVNTMGLGTNDTILALTERMGTAEGEIDNLQTAVSETLPQAIEDAAGNALDDAKSYVDGKFTDANLAQYTTEQEVKDIIDGVIAGAADDETYNSLTKLVDYIDSHGGEAADMAEAIEALEEKVDTTGKVSEAIAAEAKAREDGDKAINDVLATYGDIVTHDVAEFALAAKVGVLDPDNSLINADDTIAKVAGDAYALATRNGNEIVNLSTGKMNKLTMSSDEQAGEILVVTATGHADFSGKKVTDFAEAGHNHDDKYVMSVTEATNSGLKVDNTDAKNPKIAIDDTVVFILNGGNASNLDD